MTYFRLRPGKPADHPFVVDSWLKSYEDSPVARDLRDGGVYWTEYKAVVRRLLETQQLVVACAARDDDAILGWACTSAPPPEEPDPRVFYVYVRGRWSNGTSARRLGIARALLAPFLDAPCVYTHRPAHGRLPIPESWTYNPERNRR